ncbi:MAG: NADH-quinone oxidoreductase subunit N [Gammaproteobacteria bacterium]|nr:NADH-quinone oxidoreductase subunit N [Gammaproteobacteria bacterium]MDE0252517.1 NADH-quinone oxidoreductase subunit N [Gammaproteobacteria bacterium]MDE0402999.1 NADH-quinone oxidoreductase subunit N [Gammaproteobacteria bacterium]
MFQAGLPYLILTTGLIVLMVGVSIHRSHQVAWSLTVLTLIATLISHFFVYEAVATESVVITELFRVDSIAYFFNAVFLLATLVLVLFAQVFLDRRTKFTEEFYVLILAATLGAMMLPASTHFASLILGLEVISISLYALIAYPDHARPPLEAGLKYLVLSGVGTATLLMGMAFIYAASGNLDFSSIHITDGSMEGEILFLIGNTLFWCGIAFKLSLVPFHIWTPDVYHGAPSVVTAFLATVSKGAVFAVVLRYVIEADILSSDTISNAIMLIACASMVIGNLLALLQNNLKRLLAYSSIAHMGYLLIVVFLISVNTSLGYESALFYLVSYFVMTLAAFGVIIALSSQSETEVDTLNGISGLLWTKPAAGAVLIAAALSLAGIPLTVGFFAKYYLFTAGISEGMWPLVVCLVLGSGLGIFYYVRVIFRTLEKPQEDLSVSVPWLGLSITVLLAFAIIIFGLYPTPLVDLIRAILVFPPTL